MTSNSIVQEKQYNKIVNVIWHLYSASQRAKQIIGALCARLYNVKTHALRHGIM